MSRFFVGLSFLVGLVVFGSAWGTSTPAVSPAPSVSTAPSSSGVPTAGPVGTSPQPSVSAKPALTLAEIKQLSREFLKAQATELEALKHRQKTEMKELVAAQRAYRSEWQKKEAAGAKEYYKVHKGAEFRTYMHDLQARRKAMVKMQDEEKHRRQQENESRFKSLKQEHEAKLKEFKETLSKGERPAAQLWPKNLY
jgi:hypothetical protein